jgi:aerobic-type carbon monoxide dehydrogenase small subunit (CoxS/CutS family)
VTHSSITTAQVIPIRVTVNGREHELRVAPHETLIELIRDRLGLTGTKKSCDVQVCGACTVLLDGRPVSSCTMLAFEARNTSLLTIEGMASGEALHPIQAAFIEHSGFQCGFCTPGMILATKALLDESPTPTEDEIKHYLRGNICRCTGYKRILEAVLAASQRLAEGRQGGGNGG